MLDLPCSSHKSQRLCSFLSTYFLSVVHWVISIVLSSSEMIFPPLCPLYSAIKPMHWFFFSIFTYCSFHFYNSVRLFCIYFLSLLRFSVSYWELLFFPLFQVFVIACWNIFMMVSLKSLSDNSNMFVISVLMSVNDFFSFKLRFSRFLVWWKIFFFYWNLNIWGIML